MYSFALFDSHEGKASEEVNEAIFASGPVFGVKVAIPTLAKRCVTNFDPQHSGGNAERAAIEEALKAALPLKDATLATTQADLDSVGSMAVLSLREQGYWTDIESIRARVACIADSDKFETARALPTKEAPWPEEGLVTVALLVMDSDFPMAARVTVMEHWLLEGIEPKMYRIYRSKVEVARRELISALESGGIASGVHFRPGVE